MAFRGSYSQCKAVRSAFLTSTVRGQFREKERHYEKARGEQMEAKRNETDCPLGGEGERQGAKSSHIQAAHFLTNYCCKTSLSPPFQTVSLSSLPHFGVCDRCKNWRAASTAGDISDTGKSKRSRHWNCDITPTEWMEDVQTAIKSWREVTGISMRVWWQKKETSWGEGGKEKEGNTRMSCLV